MQGAQALRVYLFRALEHVEQFQSQATSVANTLVHVDVLASASSIHGIGSCFEHVEWRVQACTS